MTNYTLGQYNHKINGEETWLTPLNVGVSFITVAASTELVEGFEDFALKLDDNIFFEKDKVYYCHCKIKRTNEDQKFAIKLINTENTNSNYEQFIKNINVAQKESEKENQWFDIDFIFSPQSGDFNALLFALTRTTKDFTGEKRIPIIAFLEISVVNNVLDEILSGKLLLKMGIQSRPGLKMCINREEISIGKTGIYELKNGEIKVSFLSFITPATNKTDEELIDIIENKIFTSEVDSKRPFDGFALDYIYA